MASDIKAKAKFKFKMPHAYVIILCLIIFFALLTYIIPAGKYDTVEVNGRKGVIDPQSYHTIEQTPVSPWDVVLSIPQGMVKQAGVIFMLFVISGSLEIVNSTGALAASIGRVAQKNKDRLYVAIPAVLLCFVAMGAMGVGTSIVAFIPLGLLLGFGLGADACVGVALVGMGMNLGFSGGAFVASTTGTAHTIIGLPMFSGFGFRLALSGTLWVLGSLFLIRYIKQVRNDPTKSAVYGVEEAVREAGDVTMPELTGKRKLVLAAFGGGFCFVVYGALHSWSASDAIPGVFLVTSVVCGLIYGYTPSEMAKLFVEGAKKITFGALICGVAGGIGIVMTNGNIIHTVVHGLVGLMSGLSHVAAALMMYLINIIINCFLTSGSGQAAAVIPILSPVGDALGLSQQVVTLAFNLGDGFTNQVLPTSAVTMAGIAMGGIPFGKWLKFTWKWLLMNLVVGGIFLVIATLIHLGPF